MTEPVNFHPYVATSKYAHNLMADQFVTLGSNEGPFNLITITQNPYRINIMYVVTTNNFDATFDTHGHESVELVDGTTTKQLVAIFDALDAIMVTPIPRDDCDEYDECHVPQRLVDQFTTSEMAYLYETVNENLWEFRVNPPAWISTTPAESDPS